MQIFTYIILNTGKYVKQQRALNKLLRFTVKRDDCVAWFLIKRLILRVKYLSKLKVSL